MEVNAVLSMFVRADKLMSHSNETKTDTANGRYTRLHVQLTKERNEINDVSSLIGRTLCPFVLCLSQDIRCDNTAPKKSRKNRRC